MLIVHGGFALVFHTHIYCILIRLAPLLLTFLYSPVPTVQQLSVHCAILSSYSDALYFILFIHYHSLFFCCLSVVPSDRSASVYSYIYIHIYIYIYIYKDHTYIYIYFHLIGLTSTYEVKYMTLILLNLAYFT
jgi:hypothetical protein